MLAVSHLSLSSSLSLQALFPPWRQFSFSLLRPLSFSNAMRSVEICVPACLTNLGICGGLGTGGWDESGIGVMIDVLIVKEKFVWLV